MADESIFSGPQKSATKPTSPVMQSNQTGTKSTAKAGWKGRFLITRGSKMEKCKKKLNDNKIQLLTLNALTSDIDKESKIFLYPVELEDLSNPILSAAMSKCTNTTFKYTLLPPTGECSAIGKPEFTGSLHLLFKRVSDAKAAMVNLPKFKKDLNIFRESVDGSFGEIVSSYHKKYLGTENMRNCCDTTLFATDLADIITPNDLWDAFPMACRVQVKTENGHRNAYVMFSNKKCMDANMDWLDGNQPREELQKTQFYIYSDLKGASNKTGQKPKDNPAQGRQPPGNRAHGKQTQGPVQQGNRKGQVSSLYGKPEMGRGRSFIPPRPHNPPEPDIFPHTFPQQKPNHNVAMLSNPSQPRISGEERHYARSLVDGLLASLSNLSKGPMGANAVQKLAEGLMAQIKPGHNVQKFHIHKVHNLINDIQENRGDPEEIIQRFLNSHPQELDSTEKQFHTGRTNLLDFQRKQPLFMAQLPIKRDLLLDDDPEWSAPKRMKENLMSSQPAPPLMEIVLKKPVGLMQQSSAAAISDHIRDHPETRRNIDTSGYDGEMSVNNSLRPYKDTEAISRDVTERPPQSYRRDAFSHSPLPYGATHREMRTESSIPPPRKPESLVQRAENRATTSGGLYQPISLMQTELRDPLPNMCDRFSEAPVERKEERTHVDYRDQSSSIRTLSQRQENFPETYNERTENRAERTEYSAKRTEYRAERTEYSAERTEYRAERTEYSADRTEYNRAHSPIGSATRLDEGSSLCPSGYGMIKEVNSDRLTSINMISKIVKASKDLKPTSSREMLYGVEGYSDRNWNAMRRMSEERRLDSRVLPTPRSERDFHLQRHTDDYDSFDHEYQRGDSYSYSRGQYSNMS